MAQTHPSQDLEQTSEHSVTRFGWLRRLGRGILCAGPVALIYAWLIMSNIQLEHLGHIPYLGLSFWLDIVLMAVAFFVGMYLLWHVADAGLARTLYCIRNRMRGGREARLRHTASHFNHTISSHANILVCVSVIALVYVVVWLATWPGYFTYDTINFVSFVEQGSLNTTQSVLHTVFVGSVLKVGLYLFNSWNAAVALYMGVQLIIVLAAIRAILRFVDRCCQTALPTYCAAAFFAGNPVVVVHLLCSAKDTLFTCALVLLMLQFMDVDAAHTNPRRSACCVAVLSLIVALYRNNALIVLCIFALVLVLTVRKNKHLLLTWVAPLAVCGLLVPMIITGPVYTLMGVERSNALQEMISQPANQIVRAVATGQLDAQELQALGIDPQAAVASYNNDGKHNSDAIRPRFWPLINQDGGMKTFMFLWAKTFFHYPGVSLDAGFELTRAALIPGYIIDAYQAQPAFNYNQYPGSYFSAWVEQPAHQTALIPGISDALFTLMRSDTFAHWPWAVLASPAVYVWLALFAGARFAYKKQRAALVALVLLGGLLFTNLLGPTVLIRYYLPFFVGAPALLAHLFGKNAPKGELQSRLL